ncbi:MAG: hypothetical protein WCB48_10325, partial [Casimicrobiaceae bacterium]
MTKNGDAGSLVPATADGMLGPYAADDFEITTGAAGPTLISASALHYFRNECIAVPRPGIPAAGHARRTPALDDVVAWSRNARLDVPGDRPPLILLGAPLRIDAACLSPDAQSLALSGTVHPFALAPRLALNRSWFDASSAAFF